MAVIWSLKLLLSWLEVDTSAQAGFSDDAIDHIQWVIHSLFRTVTHLPFTPTAVRWCITLATADLVSVKIVLKINLNFCQWLQK